MFTSHNVYYVKYCLRFKIAQKATKMCIDKDLFGEVIITFDDVELWLNLIPRHLSASQRSRALTLKITMLQVKLSKPS